MGTNNANTVNPGASLRMLFQNSATCHALFDASFQGSTGNAIWYRLDNNPWVRANVTATMDLTGGVGLTAHYHLVEILFAATDPNTAGDRWTNLAPAALYFQGFALDGGATSLLPLNTGKRAIFFTDSIGEGGLDADGTSQPTQNDATMAFAYLTGKAMGYETAVVPFAGQGYTRGGNGNVPSLPATYASLRSGVARSFANFDLIVLAQGQNDGSATAAATTSACLGVIQGLLAAAPAPCRIVVLGPVSGVQKAALQAAVTQAASARVFFLDCTGFTTMYNAANDSIHPIVAGHAGQYAPNLIVGLTALLVNTGSPSSRSYAFVA